MRILASLALVVLPTLGWAQEGSERLLSAKTQIYLRWDGIEKNRAAFSQTALGKMLQGDSGTFLRHGFQQLEDGIGTALTVERLLSGEAPERLQQMQADASEITKLLPVLSERGFIFAAEVNQLEPPAGRVTLILPEAGVKPGPFLSALRLAINLARGKIDEKKFENRTIYQVGIPGIVALSWWIEGKDAVVMFGNEPAEQIIKKLNGGKGDLLGSNPLYQRVQGFKDFTTSARGFIDVASLSTLANSRGAEVRKMMDDLGLNGLKQLTFYSGFAGDAERGLVELDMPGPRKGLLSLFKGKTFTLADLPPLPPDVVAFSMNNLDAHSWFELSLKTIEAIIAVTDPAEVAKFKEGVQKMDQVIGLDLRKELLAHLDDRFIYYLAPSEGPLNLGQVFLIKVKDEAQVRMGLERLIKGLAKAAGGDMQMKKRNYHGVELREMRFRQQGMFFMPTYAIHKNWLVLSLFPQPVQGFVLRSQGELTAWKPSGKIREVMESMPTQFQALSYSDPRPTITQILSIAPLIGGLVTSFMPDTTFEVSAIPNAQEANKHLFPNVSVVTDDGKVVRLESRASLPLPLYLTGIDAYSLVLYLGLAFRL